MEYLVWYLHFHDMIVFCFEMPWGSRLSQVCIKFAPFHPVSPRLARSSYIQYISGQSIWICFGGNSVAAEWQQALSLICQGPKHADGMTALGWDWTGWRCWVDSMFHPCPKNWHPCPKKWHPCPKNWHPLYSGWKAIESPYLIEKPLKSREHTCMDMYRYSLVIPVLDFFLLLGLCQNLLRDIGPLSRFGHKPSIAFFRSLTSLLYISKY